MLRKEILASRAEHTTALHERFVKPIPCRDKTKLLLTLRQWVTDLKELQAAGTSPSKETVVQSLKTVTGGIRDLNNVHDITELLAPNDPGKLFSATTTARLGRERVPKVTTKAHTAQRFLVNTLPRALSLEGDKCSFSHKSSDSKYGDNGNKSKKSSSERDPCKKCGKITNTPHWARSCVLTSTPVSSPPEVSPPGLSTL